MMTQDEIEKDIIWRKLNGDFSNEYLRDQYQFSAAGEDRTYVVDCPGSWKFSSYVYVDSDIVPPTDYILNLDNGHLTLDFNKQPAAGSDIIINVCY